MATFFLCSMMLLLPINSVKGAFIRALQGLPDFQNFNSLEIGTIVDQIFKSLMNDLMQQFGMTPGEDYDNNLRSNEPTADFVIRSERANQIVKALLEGRVVVIKEHTRISKTGKQYQVSTHFRIKSKS